MYPFWWTAILGLTGQRQIDMTSNRHKYGEYNPNGTICPMCGRSLNHAPGVKVSTFCGHCERMFIQDEISIGAEEMLRGEREFKYCK